MGKWQWVTAALTVGAVLGLAPVSAPAWAMGLAAYEGLPEPVVPFTAKDGDVAGLMTCLRGRTTLVSGHRGGVESGYPENAIETMANTLVQAPMFIEVDIRTTRDGELVLMHDKDLERTTTGSGAVRSTDWAVIKDLFLEDGEGTVTSFRPPLLRDALRWAKGRTVLQLDVKRGTKLADVVAIVQEEDAQGHAAVIVYSVNGAKAVHAMDPSIMLSVGADDISALETMAAGGVNMDNVVIWTGVGDIKPGFWQAVRDRGHSVAWGALWTIDKEVVETGNEARYAEIAAQGVDLMATDRHHQAYEALQANGSTPAALKACAVVPK